MVFKADFIHLFVSLSLVGVETELRVHLCAGSGRHGDVGAQSRVLIWSKQEVDGVVQLFEEVLGHGNDSSRNDFFFVLLKQLGLFMSMHLDLFKFRLATAHSQDRLILTARAHSLLT